jgi:hypothetical protein
MHRLQLNCAKSLNHLGSLQPMVWQNTLDFSGTISLLLETAAGGATKQVNFMDNKNNRNLSTKK